MELTTFCNQWLSAWTGNRPSELLQYYTADCYYSDPANPKGLQGHNALLPYFSKLLKHNPQWVWQAVEIIPTAKGFTLKWKATIPVGTQTITEYGLDIVELHNGQISRNEVYFDRANWLKALQAI